MARDEGGIEQKKSEADTGRERREIGREERGQREERGGGGGGDRERM